MPLFGRSKPAPSGTTVEVWGQRGWHHQEVAGESHHYDAIRALLPRQFDEAGAEVIVPVALVHNPNNPYDRNAVEVRASTGLLGHLPREDAVRYAPVLATLQSSGRTATTTARVWGGIREDWETGRMGFWGNVRVDVPEPHMLVPLNAPPAETHRILPVGSAVQVTGEDEHMPALTPYLNANGECWVHATLHAVEVPGPRSNKRLAEVHINGQPVGCLSPKLSQDLLPVVDYLQKRQSTTCVRAIVKGNQLKAEVVLYTARTHELPPDWFDIDVGAQTPSEAASSAQRSGAVSPDPGSAPTASATSGSPSGASFPPAGWYDDPYRVARLRYWDGSMWTGHTNA